jgi:hypothetical protein
MRIPDRWFTDVVTINTPRGTGDDGQPIPGPNTDYPARIDSGERIVRDEGGTEVTTRLTVKIAGAVDMETVKTLTVPEYGRRAVVSWRKVKNSRTVAYTEVFLS